MNHQIIEIGKVAKVMSSKRIFAKEYVSEGIPFFRSKEVGELCRGENVKTELFISESRYNEIKDKYGIPEKGDLLLTSVGSIGNTWIVDDRKFYYKDGNLTQIKPSNKLDVAFLNYFIKSPSFWQSLSSNSTGTAYSALTISALCKIKIPLPPLENQQYIAQILDDAAELRDKTKQLITEYDLLAQSIFLEMFGDPYHNPKNFELVRIKYFIDKLESGRSVNSSNEFYTIDHAGVLKTSCVYNGVFEPSEAKVIVENERELAKLNPKKDSIIISRMNTEELVGRSAYVQKDYRNLYIPDRLWQSVKTLNKHSVLWLSYAIGQSSFMSSISRVATGTSGSMKNVSQKKFLNLDLINPPINLQNQFTEKITLIEQQKELAQQELKESEDLFNSLLQKAFKGELVAQTA